MGMSASQARLLSITARMNDVEFKSQSIANVKVRLADESEQLAMKYTQAISQQKITFTTYKKEGAYGQPVTIDLDSTFLNSSECPYRLCKADGTPVDDTLKYDSAQLYAMIESGEFILKLVENGANRLINVTEDYRMNTVTDNSKFAQAEAEYNAANMKINNKEKLLDNELKKLDTEHNALQTEADSVKNLIGKNIEKSFNLFA